jgi:hypothetical protein
MFTTSADFLALVRSRRPAPRSRQALSHGNDNLPGVCRPAVGRRRSAVPALACHWFDRNGRLECRWQIDNGGDAPAADLDPGRRHASKSLRCVTILPGSRGFHITVFQPSYQQRDGRSAQRRQQGFQRERID